jgi:hypothetical protein
MINMNLETFFTKLNTTPEAVEFAEIMAVIDEHYMFTETAFSNGSLENQAGKNSGSCKLFSFAKINDLTKAQTLACFGHYYRDDVLNNPDATDHQNIRNFMNTGWQGISFAGKALVSKS